MYMKVDQLQFAL